MKAFGDAMAKLAVLGQDTSNMVDCTEVIPEPKPLPAANCHSVFPPGFTNADVDQAVRSPLSSTLYFSLTAILSVWQHTLSIPPNKSWSSHPRRSCVSRVLLLATSFGYKLALQWLSIWMSDLFISIGRHGRHRVSNGDSVSTMINTVQISQME